MGLFSAAKKSKQANNPTRRELQKAFMIVGCIMAISDGEAESVELKRMQSAAARMPLFANNTADEDTEVLIEASDWFDEEKAESISWAISVLRYKNWGVPALCFICEVMVADGQIDDNEISILLEASELLGINEEKTHEIYNIFTNYYQKFED